jgi:hypothetical protein
MKKVLTIAITALTIASFTATGASAKKYRHHRSGHAMTTGMSNGSPGMTGGNAALTGNNGNSGSGSNSLGHIKGGNVGGGQ